MEKAKMYIKPDMNISVFECENVETTASSVMLEWQDRTDNSQVRILSYEELRELKVEF